MRKVLLSLLIACFAMNGFAQLPLTYSTVIHKDGTDAKTLYELTQNWMAQMFRDSHTFLQRPGEEITGKGRMAFSTNMQYSSIKGNIDYSINVQFKDGKLKLTMSNFNHTPEIIALFNNTMGVLVDSLPKKLDDMGITGVNRKACYKYYFKHGVPLCKMEFDRMSESLKSFIDNRNATKEDW